MAEPPADASQWLPAARAGCREALGQALEACRRYLLLVAERELDPALRAKGGASDLVQQTFLEAQRDFAHFRGDSEAELLAWLKHLLRHNVGKFARTYRDTQKRGVGREVPLDGPGSDAGPVAGVAADTPTPSALAMQRERDEELEQALARLPEDYQRVLALRYREERSFEEIGRLLQRSADAARKLWARAVERLQDGTVQLWNAPDGKPVRTLARHKAAHCLAFHRDGHWLASASGDTSWLHEVATGREIRSLKGHASIVRSLMFSPDGQRLASGGEDRLVKLWDPASGQVMLTLKGHKEHVYSVAFSQDGRHLASASQDETVRLWTIGEESSAQQTAWHRRAAEVCAGEGQWSEALWHLDHVMRLEPGRGVNHVLRGYVRAGLRQWDAALADFAEARKLSPHDGGVWLGLYCVHAQLEQREQAASAYARAVAAANALELRSDRWWQERPRGLVDQAGPAQALPWPDRIVVQQLRRDAETLRQAMKP